MTRTHHIPSGSCKQHSSKSSNISTPATKLKSDLKIQYTHMDRTPHSSCTNLYWKKMTFGSHLWLSTVVRSQDGNGEAADYEELKYILICHQT